MNCIVCKKRIPKKRLAVLPETKTCVKCSLEEPIVGITVWDKATPELVIVKSDEAEQYWKLERSEGRLGRLK